MYIASSLPFDESGFCQIYREVAEVVMASMVKGLQARTHSVRVLPK